MPSPSTPGFQLTFTFHIPSVPSESSSNLVVFSEQRDLEGRMVGGLQGTDWWLQLPEASRKNKEQIFSITREIWWLIFDNLQMPFLWPGNLKFLCKFQDLEVSPERVRASLSIHGELGGLGPEQGNSRHLGTPHFGREGGERGNNGDYCLRKHEVVAQSLKNQYGCLASRW